MEQRRPEAITAICYFYWLHALGALALIWFAWLPIASSAGDGRLSMLGPERISDLILACCSTSGLAVGAVLFAVVGWGLWRLRRWARRAAIGLAGLLIALGLFSLAAGGLCGALYTLVLYGLVLWQLLRRDTKVAFGLIPAARRHPGLRVKDLPLAQR
jgi:hypothetical protein